MQPQARRLRVATLFAALLPAAAGCSGISRAPDASGALETAAAPTESPAFTLSSLAVESGRLLAAYRCEQKVDGVEASIPLAWSGVPAGAQSLAIVMHHYPDPTDTTRVSSYLLLWAIPPTVTSIGHGEADDGPWYMGANKDATAISYTSPCSRGSGTHAYTITLYALTETLSGLPSQSSIEVTYPVLSQAIARANVIATSSLTFTDTTP